MFTFKDYIYQINKEKSFTLAARKLYLSQPALSICVKKTEEKLGAEIFDRNSSPIKLTESGNAYIKAVEQIYAIEKDLQNKIVDLGKLNGGKLSVSSANVIFTCVLSKLIEKFTGLYPKVDINLTESFSADIKNKVAMGLIDLVIDYDFDKGVFKSYPLKIEKVYLCANKNSETAKKYQKYALTREEILSGSIDDKKAINVSQFSSEQFIIMKKKNDMHRRAMKIFAEHEVKPIVKLELDQLKTCYELSCQGLGVAFVSDTLIKNANNDNGVFFKISSPHAKRELCIAHKKGAYVSGSMKKFIEIATDYFENNS